MSVRDWGVFRLHMGDCLAVLAGMAESSVDSIVTDPPYELGFMGKSWDRSGVAFDPDTWRAVLRVLKPGGHMVAFSGTRTYHRMVCAIEDAGFEIRDQLAWMFASGFPKSHNGEWGGTALKPAHEPICLARKPLAGTVEANWREHGTGALNIDGCRVGYDGGTARSGQAAYPKKPDGTEDRSGSWARTGHEVVQLNIGRWPANLIHDGSDEVLAAFPQAPGQIADASTNSDARKTQNVYGAMKRGNEPSANSENEGAVGFRMKPGARRADTGSAARFFYCSKASRKDRDEGLAGMPTKATGSLNMRSDSHAERNGALPAPRANTHPTVKPTDLMRYLCRLITPPGGVVLDPFAGSGSTGKAAVLEGFSFIGIDLSAEYVDIAERRIATAVFGAAA